MNNNLLDKIIQKIDRGDAPDSKWPDCNGNYWALCPYHNDRTTGSFSVREKGFNCFSCGESGGIEKLAKKLGIPVSDAGSSLDLDGLTLAEYAKDKLLDQGFLKDIGITERKYNGVLRLRIPYFNDKGEEVATRYRFGLKGKDRFRWSKGSRVIPYGIWKLDEVLQCCIEIGGELPIYFFSGGGE